MGLVTTLSWNWNHPGITHFKHDRSPEEHHITLAVGCKQRAKCTFVELGCFSLGSLLMQSRSTGLCNDLQNFANEDKHKIFTRITLQKKNMI